MISKVYISYFYQIRFFPKHFIPLSTAIWDPKWYHDFKDEHFVYIDKRGVINGYKFIPFVPGANIQDKCRGPENSVACDGNPDTCDYLKGYYEQISNYKVDKVLETIWKKNEFLKETLKLDKDIIPVFMVHEAPTKECSERRILFKYFNENNIKCEEFSKDNIEMEDLFNVF